MSDEKKSPPKDDEPEVIDFEQELGKGKEMVAVGIVRDPLSFDVGIAPSLEDAIVLYFAPPDSAEPPHALAFNGAAADKLLRAFYVLLHVTGYLDDMEESIEEPKKKVTLH